MNDSKRLDAIGEYGLCVATHDVLVNTEWTRTWICQYLIEGEAKIIMGGDIREVIDAAVAEIQAQGEIRH